MGGAIRGQGGVRDLGRGGGAGLGAGIGKGPQGLEGYVLVLFKAQLGEPYLEGLIFVLRFFFTFFSGKTGA